MTTAARMPQRASDEISIRDLYSVLSRGKRLIISLTALLTVAAMLASFMLPKRYRATVVIAPVTSDMSGGRLGGLGAALSQFGGLASLVGLGPRASMDEAQDVATLESESLTQKYIEQNDLLPILFAKQWDARTRRWKTTDPGKTPTLWKGNRFFKSNVRTVTEDAKTGLIRLSVTWTDPNLAAQWANGLVGMTNDFMRTKAIDEADRDIAYLTGQAEKTSIVEVRQGIYTLLQEEIGNAMVAQGKREYALKVIDPAFAPERPYSPVKTLWTLAGFFSGLLISCGVVIFRASWSAPP